ncbi:hypothetical protein Tco_0400288 [Tanacetum coccineum]
MNTKLSTTFRPIGIANSLKMVSNKQFTNKTSSGLPPTHGTPATVHLHLIDHTSGTTTTKHVSSLFMRMLYVSDVDEGPMLLSRYFMAYFVSSLVEPQSSPMRISNPVSSSIFFDTEDQNVPTEVSADTSDKVSMIAILTDLKPNPADGHAKLTMKNA